MDKEFTDDNGRVVRTISAGRRSTLIFTNASSGATVELKSNGHRPTAPSDFSSICASGHAGDTCAEID
ncbi:MAG TPA: hypothetical protein VFR88_03335 [Microlunatus sp.]|nr:hypothetical protein [Microlunatus sp.]